VLLDEKKIQNPLPFHKFNQKLVNSDVTKKHQCFFVTSLFTSLKRQYSSVELYCLFIAADSIVDAISFIRHVVL